jgi:hypothetical protein
MLLLVLVEMAFQGVAVAYQVSLVLQLILAAQVVMV